MEITKEEIYKTASLAKLKFTEEEFISLEKDLRQIFHFIESMDTVDCNGVEPLFCVTAKELTDRDDVPTKTPGVDELLYNAKTHKYNMFAVSKFVE